LISVVLKQKSILTWVERSGDNFRSKMKTLGHKLKVNQFPFVTPEIDEAFEHIIRNGDLCELRRIQVIQSPFLLFFNVS
jgi:hypothetical protein